jgi:transglutaminase-like putative cysteine protease
MEPTEQRWLFALDYPALKPPRSKMTVDYQLLSNKPITQLKSYTMASNPQFLDSPKLGQTLMRSALALPEGYNPRTAEMVGQWRSEARSDTEIVRRALGYFNQEKFHYTLNPPLLSRHTVDEFLFTTREGFCEHYASAFTVMMRMAGIPARVVTGYQGGWYSDLGAYVLVRQSDAHAWSEVWIRGSGWTRIDPTAAVAPERVQQGSVSALTERRHMFDFEWLLNTRNTFDLLQRGWNNWVIAFDSRKQSSLFAGLGWGFWDSTKLAIALIAAILAASMAVVLLLPLVMRFRSSRKKDPLLRLWHKFHKKLGKAGFNSSPSMSPRELARLANSQLEYKGDGINRIVELYLLCRYSAVACSQSELAELIDSFHPQQVSS